MSAELAVLAPALLAVLAFIIVAGRTALIGTTVAEVASAAARQASLARTDAEAQAWADAGARDELDRQRLTCTGGPAVTIAGAGEVMQVQVTCRLSSAESWLPFERTVSATQVSPRDPWRGGGT
jgi:hypothetical protein